MGVDYEQQLKDNETALADELKKSNESFDTTASKYQTVVDGQMQQLEKNKEEQTRLQQEQTDFTIDQIEQKQEQAEKDYTKEQQAAYGDYKRQTDPYGVNAEQMAALGLSRSGYSESANVAMYTAYQNRVATARASFEQAKQTFENAIREAKLTNDINLAQIAQQAMEQSLALAMDSVVYLGNLELEKAATASSIKDKYYGIKQDILAAQEAERAAQEAERAAAKQEELLAAIQGSYNITQDTPVEETYAENRYTGTGGNAAIYGGTPNKTAAAPAASGEADFSAVAAAAPAASGEADFSAVAAGVGASEEEKYVSATKIAEMDEYLTALVAQGSITEDEALAILEGYIEQFKNMVRSTKGWSVVDDGGANIFGIDRNAIVKAPNGEQYSLKNLMYQLVDLGMSKSEARKLVKTLQDNLGGI